MKKLVSIPIFILVFNSIIFACSFNEFVPFEFNPTEYVFLGKVIGYTDKVETVIEKRNRKTKFVGYGLKIKVENIINLPQTSSTFEVFQTYGCDPTGNSLAEIKKNFPIETQVRIVGKENSTLLGKNPENIPRVEVSPGNQGQLFNNISKKEKILTTADSIFDYRLSLGLFDTKFTTAETFVWLFEIRKDLKRLQQASSENERFEILKRLAFAYDNYQDYGKLLDKYLQDKSRINELITLKKNWEKKKFS